MSDPTTQPGQQERGARTPHPRRRGADRVDEDDIRKLLRGNQGAIAVCARDRETTRGLLAEIARRLKARWEQASTVPTFAEG